MASSWNPSLESTATVPADGAAGKIDRWTPIAAVGFCVLVLWAYLTTMGRTVPFWDAGEFITTAYILGIPHPPGTPLYVLWGRIATLGAEPLDVAARVNGLSALAATGAVLFTILATVKLLRKMWADEEVPWPLPILGGVAAGLFVAFSKEFWINAIEAEVYAISSMMIASSIWAVLRWRDLPDRELQVGWLLLVFYLLSLSIGVHLGTYLVLPGLAVFVALEWIQSRTWKLAVVVLTLVFPPAGALLVAALLLASRPRFVLALVGLFVVGVSVHLYLLIRAGVDPPPAINEADPSNWGSLWDVLLRKQYPPTNLFERRAPLWFQFDRLYFHYLREQFAFGASSLAVAVPLALGTLGAIVHILRRRRDAAMMLVHFFFMCVLLVLYLNLSGRLDPETGQWVIGEVRERAYFFVPSFQIFGMWIGMGVSVLSLEIWRLIEVKQGRTLATAALVVVIGLLTIPLSAGVAARHFEHDRSDNYVARDYGYNILNFLEPDAILFTNGDNDTFPLWYLQEVEGIRKDVRVVCLSLLNTDWYIRQCRDLAPRVPISFDDELLDNMQVVYEPRRGNLYVVNGATNEVIGPGQVNHVAVRDIVKTNDWKRPIYFAVTVPDRVGYDEQLSFEGMVFRVLPEPPARTFDFAKTYENVFENYSFRSLLNEDWTRNRNVVVDETGEYLIQNYVNVFTQLAFELHARGRYEEALDMVVASKAINDAFVQNDLLEGMILDELGRYGEAAAVFERLIAQSRAVLDASYRVGLVYYHAGRLDDAITAFERAARLTGGEFNEPTLWLARVHWDRGDPAEARRTVAAWIAAHPDDGGVRAVLERMSQGDDSLLPR